jgi:O-antigen/teichoic acid export membrane protein
MRTPAEVGWYSAGYKAYEGLTVFPTLLGAVLLPRLSRLYVEDPLRYRELSVRALRYVMLASPPIAVCAGIVAPQIIGLVYGRQYMPAVSGMRILLVAAVTMFPNLLLITMLMAGNRERAALRTIVAGLLVMTVSNVAMIYRFGWIGAPLAVALSEICVLALLLAAVKRLLFTVPAHLVAWRPALACACAGGMLYLMPFSLPTVAAILFIILYPCLLLILRTFDDRDLSIVRDLLRFRTRR